MDRWTRWNLNVGGALARRPAIVNMTTRRSRPEAPPTLAPSRSDTSDSLERWNVPGERSRDP